MDSNDKQIQCNVELSHGIIVFVVKTVRLCERAFMTSLHSPFYGEDFYCEIPRSFRHLSFYIFDRDVFRRDSSIGEWTPAPHYQVVLFTFLHWSKEQCKQQKTTTKFTSIISYFHGTKDLI